MAVDKNLIDEYLIKWQSILRLKDWDIESRLVEVEWRKSGDIKIDDANKMAILMINSNTLMTNLEELVIHELLHLRVWGLDQMIEGYVNIVFGEDEADPKREFAMTSFFKELEVTVEDLTKGYLEANGGGKPSFHRVEKQVAAEIGTSAK
jgi:hypothetical protein